MIYSIIKRQIEDSKIQQKNSHLSDNSSATKGYV
jgi:hypothetical protein